MKIRLLAFLFLACAAPALAGLPMVDVMSYFVNATGACVAGNPTNTPDQTISWYRNDLDVTSCPGHTLVRGYKGAPTFAFEVFELKGGFLRLISETLTENRDAATTRARVFYHDRRATGIAWIPDHVDANQRWNFGSYADPWFEGGDACVPHPDFAPDDYADAGFPAVAHVDHVDAWLWDHRPRWKSIQWPSGTVTYDYGPFGPYPIDLVWFDMVMGPTGESYGYGQWVDPTDGVTKGLGMLYFRIFHYDATQLELFMDPWVIDGEARWTHLVPCEIAAPCFRCPDSSPEHYRVSPALYTPVPQKHQQEAK